MATNPHFKPNVFTEQNLYEDLVIESIRMYGFDVYYIERTTENLDVILNETVEDKFDTSYEVEMYIENTEGFEGEGNLLSKFGLEIRDEATFIIAKKVWKAYSDKERPNEGDIIYLPLSKSFFEISFVEHEQPFYQLSNLPIYKLQCKLFEYSDEEFNTGISEIDSIEKFSYVVNLKLDNVVGSFLPNERISQTLTNGETISAEIVDFPEMNTLSVTNITTSNDDYAEFETNVNITGLTSGGIGRLISTPEQFVNDNAAQNDDIEAIAFDDIIDFDESNPFGDP